MKQSDLLIFNSKGIYCPKAQVYLDPWKPVKQAIITHGHSDHARYGHKNYLTHHSNIPILKHRLGDINVQGVEWDEPFQINGVRFSLHPAGHIIGSAQVRVEYKGQVWVFTGDYKDEDDGVSTPYSPIKCHTMITECTFGLPAFKWKPQEQVFDDINKWWQSNKDEGKTSVIFGYSLGKAQRILKYLDPSIGEIYTHGAIEKMTEVLRPQLNLPKTNLITKETTGKEIQGNMVVAPPSAHGSPWMRKFVPYETGTCSGWMAFRGARARRATDKGFVISDHCDWQGLLKCIKASEATRVICTHGYTDIFSKYLREIGYDASVENTDYEGEKDEVSSTEAKETA
ncbi:ligase-associated DNA damage response exonuclease [Algoriphagus sp. SE2]|uniref:ligase-associated DNA damage response exonuclease n=1 Tax=Algoriphagus sp. SE2 TaxID=3141536 RepID=UPI0031CD64B4